MHWEMETVNDSEDPQYTIVPVEALDGVTFVIQSNASRVVEILPMSTWSEEF